MKTGKFISIGCMLTALACGASRAQDQDNDSQVEAVDASVHAEVDRDVHASVDGRAHPADPSQASKPVVPGRGSVPSASSWSRGPATLTPPAGSIPGQGSGASVPDTNSYPASRPTPASVVWPAQFVAPAPTLGVNSGSSGVQHRLSNPSAVGRNDNAATGAVKSRLSNLPQIPQPENIGVSHAFGKAQGSSAEASPFSQTGAFPGVFAPPRERVAPLHRKAKPSVPTDGPNNGVLPKSQPAAK